jgi:hypothetical protein
LDGLVAVVIGLGHVSTFFDKYEWRPKGSITTRGAADRAMTGPRSRRSGRGAERDFAAQLPPRGFAKVTRS